MSANPPFNPFAASRAGDGRPVPVSAVAAAPAAVAAPPAGSAQLPANDDVAPDFPEAAAGSNPMLALANPVLALVPRLRASPQHANPGELRDELAAALRDFERRARDAGIAADRVNAARYVLCTVLDEAAASTPWGGGGTWGRHSLLVLFHNEAWGGEKVFQLMARLAENIPANRDLLELIYACLALGFEGRYAVIDNGASQLEAVRARLAQLLHRDYPRALSTHVQPAVQRGDAFNAWLPLWVTLAAVAAVLAGLYALFALLLASRSDPAYTQIQALRIAPPVAPQAIPAAAKPRLAQFLADEIHAGSVAVRDEVDRSVIVVRGDGLFAAGAVDLAPEREQLMKRIAAALKQVPGTVLVTGHTDNQPIRTLRFPSNWHLSAQRAATVRDILVAQGLTPALVRAEGRADAEPVAPNDTPGNRALNRRVEITLLVAQ